MPSDSTILHRERMRDRMGEAELLGNCVPKCKRLYSKLTHARFERVFGCIRNMRSFNVGHSRKPILLNVILLKGFETASSTWERATSYDGHLRPHDRPRRHPLLRRPAPVHPGHHPHRPKGMISTPPFSETNNPHPPSCVRHRHRHRTRIPFVALANDEQLLTIKINDSLRSLRSLRLDHLVPYSALLRVLSVLRVEVYP